ncbi:MAG: ribosomal protein S18-alanine N-acetyltransferase [Endomicrobium sp.]|jgi:ribosomal-protein-alanine N-acetyltransferase|nr:ribosomal protein S18-alanine N-acetyltransferase [Endomicrobium sp.]
MEIIDFAEKFLDEVIKIEKKSFEHPWTKDMFLDSAKNNTVRFRILTENGTIGGYYIVSTVIDEAEILNIAVNPEFRGLKFGRAMLIQIKKEAINGGVKFVFLEVRKTNIVALSLYKSLGFEEVGIRKKYYKGEDALLLRLIN